MAEEAVWIFLGESDKAADPVRLYMREMGRVPLLKKSRKWPSPRGLSEAETRRKGITRSPIAIAELLEIGEELNAGTLAIWRWVTFSDQMETEEQDDKAPEYLQWTLEGIQNVRKLYRRALKELGQLRDEQKRTRAKTSEEVIETQKQAGIYRLEIAQEIRTASKEESDSVSLRQSKLCTKKSACTSVNSRTEQLQAKRLKAPEAEQFKRGITARKRRLKR